MAFGQALGAATAAIAGALGGGSGHNMGIGVLGDSSLVFKRKFRWTFTVNFPGNTCGRASIPESFVRVASRPNLSIEETEINFLNGRTYIPGKGTWETMTVTYLDVAGHPDSGNNATIALYQWLASVFEFANGAGNADVTLKQGSQRKDYEGVGTLMLYDGCGDLLETWKMLHMFPTSINFGDLDYSSSDICDIELTLRYTSVDYTSTCPTIPWQSCCSTCS